MFFLILDERNVVGPVWAALSSVGIMEQNIADRNWTAYRGLGVDGHTDARSYSTARSQYRPIRCPHAIRRHQTEVDT